MCVCVSNVIYMDWCSLLCVCVSSCHYLLLGCAAVGQRDAFEEQALVRGHVLVEDLLDAHAALKHLHLLLLLQRHLQPLLGSQDLLFQRGLQFLCGGTKEHKRLFQPQSLEG